MYRFAFALIAAMLLAPALASGTTAATPDRLDEQNGNTVTIINKLTVEYKGTAREIFRVERYKIRGVPREKLLPLVNKRVRVSGEFRKLLGEMVLYVTSIEKAPKRDEDG